MSDEKKEIAWRCNQCGALYKGDDALKFLSRYFTPVELEMQKEEEKKTEVVKPEPSEEDD